MCAPEPSRGNLASQYSHNLTSKSEEDPAQDHPGLKLGLDGERKY